MNTNGRSTTEQAVDEAFERHYSGLFKLCLSLLGGDEQAAMDAVDSVFVIARKKAETFARVRDKKRWLFAVARNVVRNERRKRGAYRRRYPLFDPQLGAGDLTDGTAFVDWESRVASAVSEEPGEGAELDDDRIDALKEVFLNTLSEEERALFLSRYEEKASLDELSARLGISKDAVRMRIARISAKLTARIKIYFDKDRSF